MYFLFINVIQSTLVSTNTDKTYEYFSFPRYIPMEFVYNGYPRDWPKMAAIYR